MFVYILLSPQQEEEVHYSSYVHIQQHIPRKDLHLCLHHVTMSRLLLTWKKHKQEIQLCYSAL